MPVKESVLPTPDEVLAIRERSVAAKLAFDKDTQKRLDELKAAHSAHDEQLKILGGATHARETIARADVYSEAAKRKADEMLAQLDERVKQLGAVSAKQDSREQLLKEREAKLVKAESDYTAKEQTRVALEQKQNDTHAAAMKSVEAERAQLRTRAHDLEARELALRAKADALRQAAATV